MIVVIISVLGSRTDYDEYIDIFVICKSKYTRILFR
jgi:hypothetical protein